MKKVWVITCILFLIISVTSCATHSIIPESYCTNFTVPPPDFTTKIPLNAAIVIPDSTANYTFTGDLGMSTYFTLPIGKMVKKGASQAFLPIFKNVVMASKDNLSLNGVDMSLEPIIEDFSFRTVDRGSYLDVFFKTRIRFRIINSKGTLWEKVITSPEVSSRNMVTAAIDSIIAVFQEAAKSVAFSKVIRAYAGIPEKTASPTGISKEDLAAIVKAAVTEAANKNEIKTPSIQTEIDNPAFAPSERIFGDNDVAVIVGIEGYQNLPKSDYSYDDAKLVKEYIKALGIRERNIEFLIDEKATLSGIMKSVEAWLPNKAKVHSRVFIYYSGHGAPNPSTGEAFLVPYDGDPNYLNVTGYPLKRLYEKLGRLQASEVIVVLDSCFSGAGGRSVLAKGARPLVMTSQNAVLSQNMVVLSATQGSQISTSSQEKGHGIFTYYFLKALKDGKKSVAEIYEHIKPYVEDDAKSINVQQSPSINPNLDKLKGRFLLRK